VKKELDYSVRTNKVILRRAREAKRWTQETLAVEAEISKKTVENAEAGKRIKYKNAECMAGALGIPIQTLLSTETVVTQEMLEAVPLPIFFKDASGTYRGCNERFCKYLGRSREQIVGKTVFEVAPHEHAKKYKEKDDELFANPGEQIYESRVVANTVERRALFFKGTFPPSRTTEGIIGVIVDITDFTTTTRQELKRSRKK
jgi:PAS domain S-box-containing protein